MGWSTDAAGPLNCETCSGTLTIDEVSLHTPAWCAFDLSPLWSTPSVRGSNQLIPGRQGRKPYKRRLDENKFSLPFLITGYCDLNGVSHFDLGISYQQGLEANIAYLQNEIALPASGDGTREATFALPSGNVRRSLVQVVALDGQLRPGSLWKGTLEVIDVEAKLIVGGDNFLGF